MTAPAAHLRKLREQQMSRRLGVVKALRDTPNATDIELAKVFGVSRNTIAEDRKAIMGLVTNEMKTEMQLYRDDQLSRIAAKWDEIEGDASMTGAEKHLAWSRWMKLETDLRGTAAPTRSENLNVNVDANVNSLYARFVRIVGRKLRKPESWAALWDYLEALPVDPVEEPAFMRQKALPEVAGE